MVSWWVPAGKVMLSDENPVEVHDPVAGQHGHDQAVVDIQENDLRHLPRGQMLGPRRLGGGVGGGMAVGFVVDAVLHQIAAYALR